MEPVVVLCIAVCCAVVAFFLLLLKGDKASLKQIVTEHFCNEDVVVAKKFLWENCAVYTS